MTIQTLSLRSSARRTISRIALLALSVCFSHALIAQPNQPVASAEIPFAFSAGSNVLPAGHYTFVRLDQSDYALRNDDGTTVQIIHVLPGDRLKGAEGGVIRFHQYGSSYFLQDAWFASYETGIRLFEGKAERELAASSKLQSNSNITLALNTTASMK